MKSLEVPIYCPFHLHLHSSSVTDEAQFKRLIRLNQEVFIALRDSMKSQNVLVMTVVLCFRRRIVLNYQIFSETHIFFWNPQLILIPTPFAQKALIILPKIVMILKITAVVSLFSLTFPNSTTIGKTFPLYAGRAPLFLLPFFQAICLHSVPK